MTCPPPTTRTALATRTARIAAVALAATLVAGCGSSGETRADGPGAVPAVGTAAPVTVAGVPSTGYIVGSATSTSSSSVPVTSGVAGTATTAPLTTTTTVPGTDPGTLPQTHDLPTTTSMAFTTGVASLWDAIVKDDPDLALGFFFPKAAYLQVKAIKDPSGDYDSRLVGAFRADIHALHQSLGADPAAARFVGIKVPANAQWINPGVEYNKGGYYRVLDATLVYTVNGKQRSAPVKSMISWRGEWYIVHLTAIR